MKQLTLFLIILIIYNNSIAQDANYYKSIKGFTIGKIYSGEPDESYIYKMGKENISIDIYPKVELFVYLMNNDKTIYKLETESIFCGTNNDGIEKAKLFRLNIENYYKIKFSLKPVKPASHMVDKKSNSITTTEYIRIAYNNNQKYVLKTYKIIHKNPYIGKDWSITYWKVSFSITDIDLNEKNIKQIEKHKQEEQNKAKNNF